LRVSVSTVGQPASGIVDPVKILVDAGERRSAVPAHLRSLGIEVEFAILETGDYVVSRPTVERKTVADLHRAIATGRIWSQIARLACEPHRAYFLVEGANLDAGAVSRYGIRGALLQVVDNGIAILRSSDARDTAVWIRLLASRGDGGRARGKRGRRRSALSPVGLLAAVPGISPTVAEHLLVRFGSVAGVATATPDELRQIAGIGPSRSEALHRVLLGTFREVEKCLVPGRALRRRDRHPRRYPRRRLGSGGAAAPERESLALLPSGPDAVRTLPVRGTRSVNAARADPVPTTPSSDGVRPRMERISGSGNR
jgi:ERCC4-type nuclease